MRVWTVHLPPGTSTGPAGAAMPWQGPGGGSVPAVAPAPAPAPRGPLVLVREGFSWAAFFLNLPWLVWQRLWLAALGYLVLALAIGLLLPRAPGFVAGLGLQFLLGAHANDLRRRALARRGYRLAHVVAERNEDLATARLVAERPDLAAPLARAALA